MNTNLHEYFLEPRKPQKARKGNFASCGLCLSWLNANSALSTHNSELAAGVMAEKLKEIQR